MFTEKHKKGPMLDIEPFIEDITAIDQAAAAFAFSKPAA